MKNFRSYQLAIKLYQSTRATKLPAPLRNQFDRACTSIALNLAEGRGRRTRSDQIKFFHNALGSIRECQAVADLEPKAFSGHQLQALDHLAAMTYNLIQKAR